MVLIIPAIPIVHGVCGAQIAARAHETHHADGDIYSQNPIDRARLLRKENSKMIHLHFADRDPWSEACLTLICEMREAVDIPFELSLSELPQDIEEMADVLAAGVYRVFLPLDTPQDVVFEYCDRFTARKMVPTVDMNHDLRANLDQYRNHKIERLAIDISPRDTLELNVIDWDRLQTIAQTAKESSIRLTALHGVRGYPELSRLQDMNSALDSLVLCRALNENRFPCQLIWREMEAAFAFEETPSSNLWINPLSGKPHI
jgi:phosphoribosylformimino-5-aminoimidazole carboxamide ribotide isomerase